MNIRFFATTAALILLGACAATPPHPDPMNRPAAQQVASAPAAATDLSDVEHTRILAKRARELDYRIEFQHGQPFYCHTSAQLGTRFESKGCLTEPQFEDVVRNSADLKNIMLQQQKNCTGAGCVIN
jgi:hypothetical protein